MKRTFGAEIKLSNLRSVSFHVKTKMNRKLVTSTAIDSYMNLHLRCWLFVIFLRIVIANVPELIGHLKSILHRLPDDGYS